MIRNWSLSMLTWGCLSFLAISSDAWRQLGDALVLCGGLAGVNDAIADGHLFIRTASRLFCVGN